jgi:hypothetical protein
MLYAHSQFGLAPRNTVQPREPESGVGRGEPFHLRQKLFPSIVSESDESCLDIIEVLAVRVREQSPYCSKKRRRPLPAAMAVPRVALNRKVLLRSQPQSHTH